MATTFFIPFRTLPFTDVLALAVNLANQYYSYIVFVKSTNPHLIPLDDILTKSKATISYLFKCLFLFIGTCTVYMAVKKMHCLSENNRICTNSEMLMCVIVSKKWRMWMGCDTTSRLMLRLPNPHTQPTPGSQRPVRIHLSPTPHRNDPMSELRRCWLCGYFEGQFHLADGNLCERESVFF